MWALRSCSACRSLRPCEALGAYISLWPLRPSRALGSLGSLRALDVADIYPLAPNGIPDIEIAVRQQIGIARVASWMGGDQSGVIRILAEDRDRGSV